MAVGFLTLAGADFISDGAETISCAVSGDWWCAGTSAVATLAPYIPGSAVRKAIGTFCSFSGDTLVMTEEGLVPISEVDLHDKVLAYNEETGEMGYYPILVIWAHEDQTIVTLTIDGETIETTPEHPFYTVEGEWMPAGSLQVGDEIRTADWGAGTVEAIHFTEQPQIMYNLTVTTAHTYFVGNGQWLVHNFCDEIAKIIKQYPLGNHCDRCAREIYDVFTREGYKAQIGHIATNTPFLTLADGTRVSDNPGGAFHEFVLVGDTVYDAITGSQGMHIDDYLALFYPGIFDDGTALITYSSP